MKKTLLPLVVGILVIHSAQATVQTLPFVDHFNYPQGNLLTVATGVWDAGGNAGAEITVQTNSALTGPPGFAAASGNGVKWTPSGTARRNMVQFGTISSGEIYVSFLLNNVTPPGANRLIAYLENSSSTSSSPELGIFLNGSTLGIGKNASTPGVTTTLSAGTHLIVVRYTFQSGDDQADLWVDPTNTSYSAASPPASLGGTTGASDPAGITYFTINGISGTGPTLYYDEVRISANWPDVVPGTPPQPPPPASDPVITETLLAPDGSFVMRGIGGSPTGTYEVITTTDISTPLTNWLSIATNLFDVSGHFDCTNPVSPSDTERFYRVKVGGTNAVSIEAPSITNQPQAQIVLEGQAAVFSVGATGNPLNYQWYFNTNSPLSLATNSVLTISNVQSNNVGDYSVIVSNTAGSVTSVFASLTLGEPVTNGDFYVSNAGNDSNPGTYNAPFYSLQKAEDLAQPGNTIYVRGNAGPFLYTTTIRITNSGTVNAPIKIWAYPGEHPMLNFTNQPYGSSNRAIIITTNSTTGVGGNYWHIKGLEIAFAGDNAIKVEGSYNLFEQCVFHHNGDTGLQIGFAHETDNPGTWGAYNTVLNCDSYMNYDLDNRGSDADGFACKLHPGPGNMFIGCRAWKNSDDGYDLFETDDTVILSNCWAWHSGDATMYNVVGGSFQGNGNGIKLGGNGTGGSSVGVHYAMNCISFNNNYPGRTRHGFDQNSHHGGLIIYNCIAFGNFYNYFIEDSGGSNPQIVRNCISNDGSVSTFGSGTVSDHNSWQLPVSVSSSDFNSLAESTAEAPRQPDGSLPTGFARLVAGSDLIDVGVDVGLPYNGTAPDLGAFEYVP